MERRKGERRGRCDRNHIDLCGQCTRNPEALPTRETNLTRGSIRTLIKECSSKRVYSETVTPGRTGGTNSTFMCETEGNTSRGKRKKDIVNMLKRYDLLTEQIK